MFKKRNREDPEVGGSAMADIAFLLLIFFLLVTTIDIDTGIGMVLPPKPEEDVEPPPIQERNMLKILVNAEGAILMDDVPTAISEVKEKVKEFVSNNGENPELSVSPDKAIVSLKTQRATPYRIYINMLDEVMGAYAELRNEASQQQFGRSFGQLEEDSPEWEEIRELYPKKISIAEPDEG